MNNKLLLINIITLLYRESKLVDPTERASELLMSVCQTVKTGGIDLTVDKESRMIGELKNLAIDMISAPQGMEYDLGEVLQKVQIICEHDLTLFEAFRDNILTELTQIELKKACVRTTNQLRRYMKDREAKAIINKYASMVKFRPDEIGDLSKFIATMNSELEPYRNSFEDKDPAIVAELNFDKDPNALVSVFKSVQDSKSGELVLKTGWQCINKMLDGGVRLGETVLIAAMPHNNKSGFTRDMFRHFCMYNEPKLNNPAKKPMLLHISFEDEVETTVSYFYRSLKENLEGVLITKEDMLNTDRQYMNDYVIGKLQSRGFKVGLFRVNPSAWAYTDIINTVLRYEAEGYEIKALMIDYLSMMPTTGCIQGPMGTDIRDLFRRMRNFTSARKIAFVTPHQLSTDAKMLVREEATDFVKRMVGGGYYTGSKQIDQEVDTEIFIHIEKVDGKAYQTIQRGKHRGGEILDEKDKYAVLPFNGKGGLLDDIYGEDTSVPRPGMISKAAKARGEEDAFWVGIEPAESPI